MNKLLKKELCLGASPLSFLFIAGGLLALVPSYPILLGAFFATLGIFYSFQTMRENNDITYSALLPVTKSDIVKGKFAFCVSIELCAFLVMVSATLLRMTLWKDAAVYRENALMNANLVFLGFALTLFGVFHIVFVRGFFKTAYYFGKPFILYCIVALICIFAAEALHHIPGLEAVNAFGFDCLNIQLSAFFCGLLLYAALSAAAVRSACRSFEKLDL